MKTTTLLKTCAFAYVLLLSFNVFSQNPGNVSGNLQLWLKANSGVVTSGTQVTQWNDNSTNGFSATREGSNQGPRLLEDGLNFNPTLAFDNGVTQYLRMANTDTPELNLDPINDKLTFFTVFVADDADSEGAIFSKGNGSTRNYVVWLGEINRTVHYTGGMGSGAGNIGHHWGDETLDARYEPKISTGYVTDGTYGGSPRHVFKSFVNGVFDDFPAENPSSNTGNAGIGTGSNDTDILIGARRSGTNSGSGFLLHDAEIAEIIIYDKQLSATDIAKVESYLAIKYGVTLGYNDSEASAYFGTSNDYILADGSTKAWDGSDNAGYGYAVFGIARDDQSDLEQLKSTSTNVQRIISGGSTTILNSILVIESESAGIADNKSFLMVGHNGFDVQVQTSGMAERVTSTINRKWKSRESSNDVGTVKLSFDLSQYSLSDPQNYDLIVSKNENLTNYKNYIGSYNASTKVITYSGVDLDDAEYFTLAKVEQMNNSYHLDFDGSTRYVDMGNKFDIANNFTISFWLNRSNGNSSSAILSKRNYAFNGGSYEVRLVSGRVRMIWNNGSTFTTSSTTVIPQNEWHHIAITYGSGSAKIYIDGILDVNESKVGPKTNNHDFLLGVSGGTTYSQYYKGKLDEVRVWNETLSEDQLRFIMNQEIKEGVSNKVEGLIIPTTITKYDVDTLPWSNLKGYFPFSQVRGNCLFNKSSFTTDNGRLYNTPSVSIETQKAPLPYISNANGYWHNDGTWVNGSTQDTPGSQSISNSNKTIDWNIVVVNHDIIMDNTSLPTANAGNRSVLGLFLNNSTLTVRGSNVTNEGNGFTVSHYLDMDGDIVLQGESQLIQTEGSDLVVGSTSKLYRNQQGTADKYTYNYWSSPVGATNAGINAYEYKLPQVIPGINYVTSGYDGTASPVGVADYWIWKFANQLDDDYSAWQHVRSTGTLNAGEGFTMKGPGTGGISDDQNYEFSGKPNNGDISLPITAGNDYLVGNPYASAIDARQFILDNGPTVAGVGNTTGTIYFWEHWGGGSHNLAEYQGGYATYNLIGGVPAVAKGTADPDVDQTSLIGTKTPGRYIPVSQGFFVVGEATGTIRFNNGQRVFQKENTDSVFMEADNPIDSDKSNTTSTTTEDSGDSRMRLRVALNSNGFLHRQLLVGADNNATEGIDWGYDGLLYDQQAEDLYWMIEDAKYVIQGVNAITEQTVLPLGIHTNLEGLNSITLEGLDNFTEDVEVFLHDKDLEIYHDLRLGDYEFNLSPGTYTDRFEITFTNNSALDVTDSELDVFNVTYTNDIESIVITNPTNKEMRNLELFNILGQSVFYTDEITSTTHQEFKVTGLSTGAYIINIDTPEGKLSKKVIIK